MRMNELTRYFDKVLDRGNIGERIDSLQEHLGKLREMLPEARTLRGYIPDTGRLRDVLPYQQKKRGYTLPAALAVGGIAILGAIVVTAVLMNDAHRKTPKKNEDMV
jgi:hypothetical protein